MWRNLLARLPLPMLALAASYGVYSFAALFVPFWVAVVQAAAFELTYIGLAVVQGLDNAGRRRATLISVGAVVTSVLYNTLAGLFHRNTELLASLPFWGECLLAVLHGAPLAWVAYLVSDLLLHTAPVKDEPALNYARIAPQVEYTPAVEVQAVEEDDNSEAAVPASAREPNSVTPAHTPLLVPAPPVATQAAELPVCACGCNELLSASDVKGRRTRKRGTRHNH